METAADKRHDAGQGVLDSLPVDVTSHVLDRLPLADARNLAVAGFRPARERVLRRVRVVYGSADWHALLRSDTAREHVRELFVHGSNIDPGAVKGVIKAFPKTCCACTTDSVPKRQFGYAPSSMDHLCVDVEYTTERDLRVLTVDLPESVLYLCVAGMYMGAKLMRTAARQVEHLYVKLPVYQNRRSKRHNTLGGGDVAWEKLMVRARAQVASERTRKRWKKHVRSRPCCRR